MRILMAILGLSIAWVHALPVTAGEVMEGTLRLGAPFADHAVLQQGMQVPVWGWSEPRSRVSVSFANQRKRTRTNADGKWMVQLDPLTASWTPGDMDVSDNRGNSITVHDVLVGEVWLASGQSNMQWPVGRTTSRDLVLEDREDGIIPIREFQVSSVTAQLHPIDKASGVWKNGNYNDYSAVAYAFAHKLYEALDVPVGILNGSFSETSIQAWTPRIGFRDGEDEYTQSIWQRMLETDPSTSEHAAAWERYYRELEHALADNEERIAAGREALEVSSDRPGNLNGNRDASWMFNGRIQPLIPYALRGAIWNQGYANMGQGITYYNNLHSLIRGWRLVWQRPDLPVYFHQFYSPGNHQLALVPTVGGVAEMRLGTLLARDIPYTGMASQIDVQGAIHYNQKAVPAQRLALHALRNQYPDAVLPDGRQAVDLVVNGPIFRSYEVHGNEVIVSFDYAEGGLLVATTDRRGMATPEMIENGEPEVRLFYLAGEDRVWHPAEVEIRGEQAVVTSAAVPDPRGISYATGGVGWNPNLYNSAMLPMTPFMYYDQELVLEKNWPDLPLQIANYEPETDRHGREFEYRRIPLLSTQFRENAVLQSGVPVKIFGGVGVDSWTPAHEEGLITFRFAPEGGNGNDVIEREIPVTVGMEEWYVELPAMEAGTTPYALDVAFLVGDEVVQERNIRGIVFGDVYYVAAPNARFGVGEIAPAEGIVRVMERRAGRDGHVDVSRFSIAVSTQPLNRFAATWEDAGTEGVAAALGHRLAAKSGNPVGVIFMQNNSDGIRLSNWIRAQDLQHAPSLEQDYLIVSARYPWGPKYAESVRQYIADFKTFWSQFVPEMIATRAVPDGGNWGWIPSRRSVVEGHSMAARSWNVMGASFAPGAFKGLVFLTGPSHVEGEYAANYGTEMSVLANSWRDQFGLQEVPFVYSLPEASLAAGITKPAGIQAPSKLVQISEWNVTSGLIDRIVAALE